MADPILVTVTRVVAADPEQVWRAWTDADAVSAWLFRTPEGSLVTCRWAPAPGTSFEVTEDRGGVLARHIGTFHEVERPHVLSFTFRAGESGEPSLVRLNFVAEGTGTRITLTHAMDPEWADYRAQTEQGWTNIVEASASRIERQIVLTRLFRASPEQVWAAWTDPAVLPRWFGPEGFSCKTKEIDLREGGVWRFDMIGMGMTYANRHRFTAYRPLQRIAFLMDDDNDASAPFDVTIDLMPEAGGTRLIQTMTCPSAAAKTEALGYNAVELGYTTLAKLAKVLGE